jgi:hypothetical protein
MRYERRDLPIMWPDEDEADSVGMNGEPAEDPEGL